MVVLTSYDWTRWCPTRDILLAVAVDRSHVRLCLSNRHLSIFFTLRTRAEELPRATAGNFRYQGEVIRHRYRKHFTFSFLFFPFFSSTSSSSSLLFFFVLNSRDSPSVHGRVSVRRPLHLRIQERLFPIARYFDKKEKPDETKTLETKAIRYFHRFHIERRALFYGRVESRGRPFVENARTCGKLWMGPTSYLIAEIPGNAVFQLRWNLLQEFEWRFKWILYSKRE